MVTTESIPMVDLRKQYLRLKTDIDCAIEQCLNNTDFISGAAVHQFGRDLAAFLEIGQVIPCANGTDALQLALMGLGLQPGDEVIVPAFTYVATAETIVLLGLTPVWVDVDPLTFTVAPEAVADALTPRTRAVVPVHLFGQCADMAPLLQLAAQHGLFVIEDVAQALGSQYRFPGGSARPAGTLGQVGCTSFFPSKNLGCYGDGGALMTNDEALADRLRMIANHGQRKKYVHELVGVNSRLDTLQAAVLSVKLPYLAEFNRHRQRAAQHYDQLLTDVPNVRTPVRALYSTHVYHQYTLQVPADRRDALQMYLRGRGISSMIYYPLPLHQQPAYRSDRYPVGSFPVAERLCREVVSLPIDSEITAGQQAHVAATIAEFMHLNQPLR